MDVLKVFDLLKLKLALEEPTRREMLSQELAQLVEERLKKESFLAGLEVLVSANEYVEVQVPHGGETLLRNVLLKAKANPRKFLNFLNTIE